MALPTIDEDEIGTMTVEKYNNTVQQEEVTHYFDDVNLYFIVHDYGENNKISFR